jgi:hypothetical protein
MEEIWEVYVRKGITTMYYGSTLGNVGRMWNGKMKLLKPWTDKRGYKYVILMINGERITEYVHRIIAMCFLQNPHNYKEVNHIEPVSRGGNNHPSNLEWCNRKQNMGHAWENGLMKPLKGEKHGQAKITEAIVIEIFRLYNVEKWTQQKIADHFGISDVLVSKILRRICWKHVPIPDLYL